MLKIFLFCVLGSQVVSGLSGLSGVKDFLKGGFFYIAHRGACYYAPENTLDAFNLAGAMGAKMVEFDVQLSSDGQLLVIHDETIERTTMGWTEWPAEKSKKIKDLSWAELEKLEAKYWFDTRFSGARIPLLNQVIDLCLKNNLLMNLEIKTSDLNPATGLAQDPEQDEKITKNLIAWFEKIRAEAPELFEKIFSRLLISSFSPEVLYLVRAAFPEVHLAYLAEIKDWNREWDLRKEKIKTDMGALGCVSLNLNQDIFVLEQKDARLDQIKAVAGQAVLLAYTVNELNRAQELHREFGVAGVFTDKLIEATYAP